MTATAPAPHAGHDCETWRQAREGPAGLRRPPDQASTAPEPCDPTSDLDTAEPQRAPEGPGWPSPDPHDKTWLTKWRGPTWEEAQKVCRYLTADGTAVASTPQDIWRLPTVEEAVRSMTRHGANCQGVWNASSGEASFATKPDKESPLWNPYSPIIYWWTSSQPNGNRAYSIDFNGQVYSRNKDSNLGSQGFRAVKSVGPTSPPAKAPGH